MKNFSLLTGALLLWSSLAGCAAETLDGGSNDGKGGSNDGKGGSNGESGSSAIRSEPLSGTVAGVAFSPKSVELQYETTPGGPPGSGMEPLAQWFLTLRSYESVCGKSKQPFDKESAVVITIGKVTPEAGTQKIAYADGRGASFQVGVYESTDKAKVEPARRGELALDTWTEVEGAAVTGALRLEGDESSIEGTFTATVCPAR